MKQAFGSGYNLRKGFQIHFLFLIYLSIKSSLYNIEQNNNINTISQGLL